MQFNPDDYRADVAELKLTRKQEDELLRSIWEIMRLFVELGYGINSINSIFPDLFEKTDQATEKSSQ